MIVDPLMLTLLIELLVVTSVAAIAMFLQAVVRKKRDRKAVLALVAKLNDGQEQRVGESKKILNSSFGLEGGQAIKLARDIDGAERGFYQAMITTYLRRDYEALESIDEDFMAAVEAYRKLTPVLGEDGGRSEEMEEMENEIERLRAENERFSKELRSAMEAMGGVLNHYTDENFSKELKGTMEAMGDVLNDYSSAHSSDGDSGAEADDQEQVVSSEEDGIVVEEIAGADTEQPAEEAADEVAAEQPAVEVAAEAAEQVAEEVVAEVAEEVAAEAADGAEPTAQSTEAIAAAEEIDIPDYSGLEEPKLD
jgi:hypothetical protein